MSRRLEYQSTNELPGGIHAMLLRSRNGRAVVKLNESSTTAEIAPILTEIVAEYHRIIALKAVPIPTRLVS
ncbi:hypothetical protein [Enterococcus hirae]|uniref:hypothetical protein n=1 Tax=Enterococcus hirae TaxID=1354 RepID=UPI0013698CEC|nr:hypothetical protein [Enterococcus hirae]